MEYSNHNIDILTSIPGFDALKQYVEENLSVDEKKNLYAIVQKSLEAAVYDEKEGNQISTIEITINAANILFGEIGIKGNPILALLLYHSAKKGIVSENEITKLFGEDVAKIVRGLIKTSELEAAHTVVASENYIKLLLTFAEDLRVIPVKIAEKLYVTRNIGRYDPQNTTRILAEASYIYTSFSHKLGLYKIKTEFEDICLNHTEPDTFHFVQQKIAEGEAARNKYVKEFISPIVERLKDSGLKYTIKGRVKSISSIANKLKKQKVEFEQIYDLFAVRIIIDSPQEKEKAECWHAYSVVTDLYTPNPKRLKDWLSIPKSNGYESLHTTVMGPESRWVEVQIRTKRMDEIAESGFAAHWKYKGVKNNSKVDDWLANLRETLENVNLETSEKLENFKLDLFDDEIYVFTPKGDLHRLPQGATVLDFAFSIHTKIGSTCISGKVNGKNVPIRYKLENGDQIEIITSPNQTPKRDWLSFVNTSKAKNRIRQTLKEEANKQVDIAKEMLIRRFKNRKMEMDEATMMRLIKKLGFKNITDFYINIANETLNVADILEQYIQLEQKEVEHNENYEIVSADKFVIQNVETINTSSRNDELLIGEGLSDIGYSLARCCNPIYGDDIFGFVSTQGIRIHRRSCPNATDMFTRFGYRVIPARWSGKPESNYVTNLRVIGNDDIGVMNNITSILSKESGVTVRSVSIDSNAGVFHGNISIMLSDTSILKTLLKKLRGVKGVKEIDRIN